MIITEKFVFLHIPRTGGIWINETLRGHKIPGFHICHDVRADIPLQYRKLPVVAVDRDPLDWWISWFAKMSQKQNFVYDRYFSLLSNERKDFNQYVREAWENLFFTKQSPLPHLRELNRKCGPWKGYRKACSPDIWIPFKNLSEEWRDFCASGGIEIRERAPTNILKEKPKLTQSAKIFIEAMEL